MPSAPRVAPDQPSGGQVVAHLPARGRSSRDRALAAARDSLVELGASRTTMVEVARRAGVGRTTLYRHWRDVTSLFADLLTAELTEAVAAVRGEIDDADDLARMICALADHLRTDPLLGSMRRHEPELLAVYLLHRLGRSQWYVISLLRTELEQVRRTDSRLAELDHDAAAHMLFLAVQGAVLGAPLTDPPLDRDSWRRELDRLVKGYLGL